MPHINCYAYAVGANKSLCPGARKTGDSSIFDWHKVKAITTERKRELLQACMKDGLSDMPLTGRKIAVFINQYSDCIDYHFYKLDEGSTWSDKLGDQGEVRHGNDCKLMNLALVGRPDARGDIIVDQAFCGYLYVPQNLK